MAKTASLKNTVRSISVPLSVQCSSDPLMRVPFSPANPTHIKFCTVSEQSRKQADKQGSGYYAYLL